MLRCRHAFRILNCVSIDLKRVRFQKPIILINQVANTSFCSSNLIQKMEESSPAEKTLDEMKTVNNDIITTTDVVVDNPGNNKRSIEDVQSSENEHKKLKQENTNDTKPATDQPEKVSADTPRLRRKKVAILMCYSGQGYYGMQINRGEPHFKTIEGELARALKESGVITEEESNDFKKLRFQRASRTDKGVSAARQVVSMKMRTPDDMEAKINAHLPPHIRIVAVTRATQGFDCKNWASSRTYLYLLPTLAFCPSDQVSTATFRMTDDILENVNKILTIYKGTKNFHNFTSGVAFSDKSAMRYMMEFQCGKPFLKEGMEFAVIEVQGQSFMLHQIRKMIGLMIAVVRGMATESVYDKVFLEEKMDIPKAPGLGLLLERIHYLYYNRRYGNDGIHESLEWNNKNEFIENFKEEFIYSTIINTELREQSMLEWLQTIIVHKFDTIRRHENPYLTAYKPIAQQNAQKQRDKAKAAAGLCEGPVEAAAGEDASQTEATDTHKTITPTEADPQLTEEAAPLQPPESQTLAAVADVVT